MKKIIAFCSRVSTAEQQAYLMLFKQLLPECTVVNATQIEREHRHSVYLAIVANPEPEQLLQFPNLVWIHSLWAGVERLVKELNRPTFSIVRLIDPNLTAAMTDAVLAWTYYLHREMPYYREKQGENTWLPLPHVTAGERRVSLLGLGALGQNAAIALKNNGFKVSGWSRSLKSISEVTTYSGDEGLKQMLSNTDILICLLPLTADTEGLIDDKMLQFLPRESQLINFGRGPVIDRASMLQALQEGQLKHAVLDVFNVEPLPSDDELWQNPKVTVLPHISAPTNVETAAAIVSDNIRHYFATGEIPETVNLNRGY